MARGQLGAVLRQQYGAAVRDLLGSQEHPPKGAPTQRNDSRGLESGLQIPVPGGLILSG